MYKILNLFRLKVTHFQVFQNENRLYYYLDDRANDDCYSWNLKDNLGLFLITKHICLDSKLFGYDSEGIYSKGRLLVYSQTKHVSDILRQAVKVPAKYIVA